jgi:hypothetical protein
MKTICVAFFTLCLFTIANGQYAANLSFNEPTELKEVEQTNNIHKKIARRNALIKKHNRLAQQNLMQHIAKYLTYPEKLRELMTEGPDPAFSREVERVIAEAPSVIGNGSAYLGARRLVIPIDFTLQ